MTVQDLPLSDEGRSSPAPSASSATIENQLSSDSVTFSARNLLLVDLVNENDASVRLVNCIVAAAGNGKLPYLTIGEYVDAGEDAGPTMLRLVQHFGAKTLRELEALIEAEQARAPRRPLSFDLVERLRVEEERRRSLHALFADDKIGGIVSDEISSTRLANALTTSEHRDRAFTEVFADSSFADLVVGKIPGLGRKSVDDFRRLCASLVVRRLLAAGLDRESCIRDADFLVGGMNAAEFVLDALDASDTLASAPPQRTLAERLDWMLDRFPGRDAQIVRRRFGIGGEREETLEEIGKDLSVTRERIRQIESKVLRGMDKLGRRFPIERLLAAEAGTIWEVLTAGDGIVRRSELWERRRFVAPHVLLALGVMDTPLASWLDSNAIAWPTGWQRATMSREKTEQVGTALTVALKTLPIPRTVASLAGDHPPDVVEDACRLVLGLQMRAGYVMPTFFGARLARVVGLHAVLSAFGSPVDVADFLPEYLACFPSDPCSERDAEIVMDAAPHLFIEIEDGRWCALGDAGPVPSRSTTVSHTASAKEDEGTIAHALKRTLEIRGPTRLADFLDDSAEILPEGRSIRSIGPILFTRRDTFVRCLPGVYALSEHLLTPDKLPEDVPYMLNELQARLYAMARYAGEEWRTFPLWTPYTEFRLCKWARHSADADIYNSLLSIADIEAWPIAETEHERWIEQKRKFGRYQVGTWLRGGAAYERPTLDRVLAACIYAEAKGSLNWMASNRVTGRKIDAHVGAGLVALLVRLGALEEQAGEGFLWQMAHPVTCAASALRATLSEELARTGALTWNSDVGRGIAATAAGWSKAHSWIDAQAVADMLASSASVVKTSDGDEDPLSQLMNERLSNREAERREARLQWLLAE